MNTSELKRTLAKHGISKYAFSIDGVGATEEQYRLKRDGPVWRFYYYERGVQVGIREFASEDEACRFLLDTLLADQTTRR
ncbi:hypothetical protein [Bradyrhizobium sp. STM 3809]|uniref:hypothetical protein n=1 Tax=Bradyrhizobium sp. STM 3809 TaxID=551936 RepID=UPI000240A80E|nr:hypothetical protein [Bradyrhizobium sp. STM 3809]CCE03997.1 conserved hypothetical protein [Bradyrhizobium sp. STM 3809]